MRSPLQTARRFLAGVALACMFFPCVLAGQTAPAAAAAQIDTLLAASGISNVLAGMAGVVDAQLARSAAALPADQAARARNVLARHFAGDQLYESVGSSLLREASPERLAELYGWMTTGPVSEARRLAAEYRPPLPLQDFITALSDIPPPQARVLLMLRLAQAQGAGPLYLTMAEAARAAANTAARVLGANVPPFRSLPEDQVALALEAHEQQTTVLFLHRHAPLSDDLIRSVAERWESESGRWYVDALTRAVRDALLTAAERAADELKGARRDVLQESLQSLTR